VFGAVAMADIGQLICVLAGPVSAVDRVKPYCLNVMAKANIDFSGQSQGTATLLKIIGNAFVLAMVESLAEGHTLAQKSGLGSKNLHHFVETLFPGPYTAYSARLLAGDYYKRDEVSFPLRED
jgi:3-hydroxyisobutyrate dehydrogenase-like beta-hydroxyacid dehydrogenase